VDCLQFTSVPFIIIIVISRAHSPERYLRVDYVLIPMNRCVLIVPKKGFLAAAQNAPAHVAHVIIDFAGRQSHLLEH